MSKLHLRISSVEGAGLDQNLGNSSPWPLRGSSPIVTETRLSGMAGGEAPGPCGRATRSLRALHWTWRLRLLDRGADRFVLQRQGPCRGFPPARYRWCSLSVEISADCQPDHGGRAAFLTARRGVKSVPHSL